MNIIEMYEKVTEIYEETSTLENGNYWHVGIRFEDKERAIGEVITENSRHNSDREDERDFPEFDSEEYEELDELAGVSAWNLDESHTRTPSRFDRTDVHCSENFLTKHCYIIASDVSGHHDDPDDGEILLKLPVVIAKIF